jgi:hypothetical protein
LLGSIPAEIDRHTSAGLAEYIGIRLSKWPREAPHTPMRANDLSLHGSSALSLYRELFIKPELPQDGFLTRS